MANNKATRSRRKPHIDISESLVERSRNDSSLSSRQSSTTVKATVGTRRLAHRIVAGRGFSHLTR